MSHIHGKNTKPEIAVRKALFKQGFRYRINDKKLSGHPDIVLKKYNAVVFVNGCFWHGHKNCKKATLPKTNSDFWERKIKSNIKRDNSIVDSLKKSGWKVIVIWECELKKTLFPERIKNLVKEITATE